MTDKKEMDDDEIIRDIKIILAAYSEKFPQLRGKAVRPDLRDDARQSFARLLVEKLKQSNVRFFKEPSGYDPGWSERNRRK